MDDVEALARKLAIESYLLATDGSDQVIEHAYEWTEKHWRDHVPDACDALNIPPKG